MHWHFCTESTGTMVKIIAGLVLFALLIWLLVLYLETFDIGAGGGAE